MKKIFSILVIICSFSLAVNNLAKAVFEAANFSPNPTASSKNVQIADPKMTLVHVVNPASQAVSVAVSAGSQSLSFASLCNMAVSGGNDFVQNPAAVNLNLPANCFRLEIVKNLIPRVNLSVLPLAAPRLQLAVVNAGSAISTANIAQAPATQNIPILPLAAALILIGVESRERKNLGRRLLSNAKMFKSSLTLRQLQMLRC